MEFQEDHPYRREADRLLDLLADGTLEDVSGQLRTMKYLAKSDLMILADLLEEKIKDWYFPRALVIVQARRGRPAKLASRPGRAPQFDRFVRSVQQRDAERAAAALRKIRKIGPKQLEILANLMDPTCQEQSLQCKLKLVPKNTGRGRPTRSLKMMGEEFVCALVVERTPGKKESIIHAMKKDRSRATVQRIISRVRARQIKN